MRQREHGLELPGLRVQRFQRLEWLQRVGGLVGQLEGETGQETLLVFTHTASDVETARAQAAAAEGRSGAGAVRHPEAAPRPQPVLDINGQRFTLRAPSVVLGRSSAADITVEDTGVSRRHLEILHQDGVYLAVDLGSTNGSTVDGERLRGRRELTDGSVITMGRTTIVFRLLTPRSGTAWPQS